MAFLVLKFGGPCLDILFKANVLPGVSTAYRIAKSNSILFVSSIKLKPSQCFMQNIAQAVVGDDNWAISLKLDETYIKPNLSYCSHHNSAYGLYYQHGKVLQLELNEISDCKTLEEIVQSGTVHVPKECLAVGVVSLTNVSNFEPALLWPSCTKNDLQGTLIILTDIDKCLHENHGTAFMFYPGYCVGSC